MASIAGAWAVLIPAKFWEGPRGEQALRRLVSMVMGLAVGLFAWGVAEALLLELHVDGLAHDRLVFRALRPWSSEIGEGFHAADGKPLLLAYLVAFGTLFFLLRWWRQADPLRRHRLKIGSTVVSVLVACLVAAIWRFPQPWLPMTAGVVSLAVQLASPWAPGRKG
jgi:hypothetical protein